MECSDLLYTNISSYAPIPGGVLHNSPGCSAAPDGASKAWVTPPIDQPRRADTLLKHAILFSKPFPFSLGWANAMMIFLIIYKTPHYIKVSALRGWSVGGVTQALLAPSGATLQPGLLCKTPPGMRITDYFGIK